MKKRFIRWIILLVIGLGIGSLIGYFQAQNELESGVITVSPDENSNATILKQPESKKIEGAEDVGGGFSLIDHNGQKVTEANYADDYKLVFFGFTYCPAICPAELQKIALIMDDLGDQAENITPLFITVDPERDTVEVLRDYVVQFHPDIVGLTGSENQIDAVKNAFKVYASKVENEMMEGYMVDHSAFTYLTDMDNKVIAFYPAEKTAEEIAQDIREKGL